MIQVETTHVKDYNSLPQGLNPVAGGYVCVSVRDSGVGMNEGTLQQVFDPFFTLKEQGKGTGLGLATVLGIAKQNQGDVLVESEMGRGSLFRIFWPVCEGECQHKPPRKTGGLRKGKETVLFVEDEEAIRNAGAITLRRAGYNVVTADSGIAALEHLADPSHSAPDLVITDIIMPYMSGFELAARLRDVLPDVPVLFTTGYCDDVVPDFTHQDGEDHVLHKPYGAIELTHRVQQTLQSAPGIR
ncbi:MAG: response regulator [Candidatus Hydrogenedentes bacterium]|nr:response regulator [Candidatus Hydrogenedentota bacterium]